MIVIYHSIRKENFMIDISRKNRWVVACASILLLTSSYMLAGSWSANISSLMQTTESLWLRLLLSLLLGIFLSLTPCIYPMIPITIGILQGGGSTSVGQNFLRALAYTFGIATTFALLGVTAAFTGQLFGSIMNSPIVIIGIALLMAYLGFSMIGLYDMYLPRFMQDGTQQAPSGSLLGAFLFGAASGTVASPCLSPGLVLLLGIVTTLGSKVLGFALLFSFGIGLSVPLLIIGTFSSSLSLLPQAGTWMNEVKQLFGFLLLGMSLYFLSALLPQEIINWLVGSALLLIGLFYLFSALNSQPLVWRIIKFALSIAAFAGTAYLYMNTCTTKCVAEAQGFWFMSYDNAVTEANMQHKNIFIDVTAPYCSLCKAIDKKLLRMPAVEDALQKLVVTVKIDASDTDNDMHTQLLSEHNILGTPTFLIIDPATGKELKRWGGELYDMDAHTFIAELEKYSKK